jgi:hypothetical protein
MVTIFMMNEEIARGMVCFFHQKKHSYLILVFIAITINSFRKGFSVMTRSVIHSGTRFGAIFSKISPKIHLNKVHILATFCLKIPKFLPQISIVKSSYLLRLHFGRYFNTIGRIFSQNVWSHWLMILIYGLFTQTVILTVSDATAASDTAQK